MRLALFSGDTPEWSAEKAIEFRSSTTLLLLGFYVDTHSDGVDDRRLWYYLAAIPSASTIADQCGHLFNINIIGARE